MKIIHTSDWHLGQSFINQSRKAEHEAFLAWLLAQIETQQVDALIVAGDIFDTTTPPSYAREMYHQFIQSVYKLNCTLILLGGNHDSVAMLNESLPLLAALNTHLIPNTLAHSVDQVICVPASRSGANNDVEIGAIVCAIPFIRQRDLVVSQAGEDQQTKQTRFQTAITEHYNEVYAAAVAKRDQLGINVPIIATGHLTAVGATTSDSERLIYVGSLENYPKEAFPPADYIALGHIHRPQVVSNAQHIRYSGSPIALSFDELGADKQVLLVDFAQPAEGKHSNQQPAFTPTITPLLIPQHQPMQVIIGNLASIEAQLKAFTDTSDIAHPDVLPVWLFITVQQEDYMADLANIIADYAEGKHVTILKITRARGQKDQVLQQQQQEKLDQLTPQDVFSKRLEQESITDNQELLNDVQRTFGKILSDVQHDTPLGEAP